jgi:hypothetical protein
MEAMDLERGRKRSRARYRTAGDASCNDSAGGTEGGSGGCVFHFSFSGFLCYFFGSDLDSRLLGRSTSNRNSETFFRYVDSGKCGECAGSCGQSQRWSRLVEAFAFGSGGKQSSSNKSKCRADHDKERSFAGKSGGSP